MYYNVQNKQIERNEELIASTEWSHLRIPSTSYKINTYVLGFNLF